MPHLFVFLPEQSVYTTEGVVDKYEKPCGQTTWALGCCSFVQKTRFDSGKLVCGKVVLKAKSGGWSTTHGRHARFPDTPHARNVLTKHGVQFFVCASYCDEAALSRA